MNEEVLSHQPLEPGETDDRHLVEFEQGDVWLAETRLNAHQIYAGHRLIATDFYVEPESMYQPEQRFEARVARLHANHR